MIGLEEKVFRVSSNAEFEKTALEVFEFQRVNNPVYKKYLEFLGKRGTGEVSSLEKIPFMPVEFFKLFLQKIFFYQSV